MRFTKTFDKIQYTLIKEQYIHGNFLNLIKKGYLQKFYSKHTQ